MTSSNGNIFRVTGPLCGEFTGELTNKGQWRGDLMFSLICAWINDWVNNREADDLRRHHAHYDVTVMSSWWHNWNWGNGVRLNSVKVYVQYCVILKVASNWLHQIHSFVHSQHLSYDHRFTTLDVTLRNILFWILLTLWYEQVMGSFDVSWTIAEHTFEPFYIAHEERVKYRG